MDNKDQRINELIDQIKSGDKSSSSRAQLASYASALFSAESFDRCIDCYECLYASSGLVSDRDKLSALYFRVGLLSVQKSDHSKALFMLDKAYLCKRDLIELCRVFRKRVDLNQEQGRPASSDDILSANTELCSYLFQHFNQVKSVMRPSLYRLLRDSLRLARRHHTVAAVEETYLSHALVRAKICQAEGRYADAAYVTSNAIDLHPVSPFSELIAEHHAAAAEAFLSQGSDQIGELHGKLATVLLGSNQDVVNCEDAADLYDIESDSVLLIFVSNLYFPIFKAWFDAFATFGWNDYLIVALDPIAYRKLQGLNIRSCALQSYSYQKDFFWGTNFSIERLKFANSFLQKGLNCLVTGVDSLWIKNPFDLLSLTSADIVAMGLESATKNWKYNLNADFLFYRSTHNLRNAFSNFIDISERGLHDQWALNLALSDHGIEWSKHDDGSCFGCCPSLGLDVQLLPSHITSRTLDQVADTSFIFQPSGNLFDKVKQFNAYFKKVGIKPIDDALPSKLLR